MLSSNLIKLNHLYLVAGKAIADAFKADFFQNEFAHTEVKHIKTTDRGDWQGIYVRGENTYLEIFDTFNALPLGSMGFGFGVDRVGELEIICEQLKTEYPDICIRDFSLEGDRFSHFKYIEFPTLSEQPVINAFVIQYTPDTFKNECFKNQNDYQATDVTRARFNAISVDKKRLFKDIHSIQIIYEQKDVLNQFCALLHCLGFEKQGNTYHSQELKIELQAATDKSPPGIKLYAELYHTQQDKKINLDSHSYVMLSQNQAIISISQIRLISS